MRIVPSMTRQSMIETLSTFARDSAPWSPDVAHEQATHRQARIAAAEEVLLTTIEAAADAGDRDALRIWAALTDERAYAAQNAASGSPMHRKVPDYRPIADREQARLQADLDGIPAGADSAWCSACRTRREVIEVDPTASTYEGRHEMGWTNTHLACGHTEQTEARIIGSSPGGESAAEAIAQDETRRRLDRTYAAYDGGEG